MQIHVSYSSHDGPINYTGHSVVNLNHEPRSWEDIFKLKEMIIDYHEINIDPHDLIIIAWQKLPTMGIIEKIKMLFKKD